MQELGETPPCCFKVPWSSWPSFWLSSPGSLELRQTSVRKALPQAPHDRRPSVCSSALVVICDREAPPSAKAEPASAEASPVEPAGSLPWLTEDRCFSESRTFAFAALHNQKAYYKARKCLMKACNGVVRPSRALQGPQGMRAL